MPSRKSEGPRCSQPPTPPRMPSRKSEGQRRWANMRPTEKKAWNTAYQYILRLYNAGVHSYKAGNHVAENIDDERPSRMPTISRFPPSIKGDPTAAAEAPNNDHDARFTGSSHSGNKVAWAFSPPRHTQT
ncbi:hypothetical protein E4U21_005132 [Claviceps maximensis]|nr:hypothetical protein E4U21_005132 [Claviceps maximensis]